MVSSTLVLASLNSKTVDKEVSLKIPYYLVECKISNARSILLYME